MAGLYNGKLGVDAEEDEEERTGSSECREDGYYE